MESDRTLREKVVLVQDELLKNDASTVSTYRASRYRALPSGPVSSFVRSVLLPRYGYCTRQYQYVDRRSCSIVWVLKEKGQSYCRSCRGKRT